MAGVLDRDGWINSNGKPKTVEVEMPEWGGVVYVREMTASEMDDFQQEMMDLRGEKQKKIENIRARLIVRCACNESGQSILSIDDVDAIGRKPASQISRIYNACAELNHFTADDVEELAGN